MRLSGLRWSSNPPRVIGPDAAKEAPAAPSPAGGENLFALAAAGQPARKPPRGFGLLALDVVPLAEIAPPPAAVPVAPAAPAVHRPTHDPPLAPRDEATFLLHIAAEIDFRPRPPGIASSGMRRPSRPSACSALPR